ncbi:MAG: restriction endonuclease [Rubrivivax sp.]|nr:restriction endonuclease [Rubrivivax sp.]MDP3083454.1 restriction endonuclease [Rubrivivax sp.]
MKLQMAPNSLFAKLLRSPWWISLAIAAVLSLLAAALLPAEYRVVGAMSSFPFVVISALAARRQWHLPNAAKVSQTHDIVSKMNWPAFADLLEQAFRRDGYSVRRDPAPAVDFALERQGRTMYVSARRWKSARSGLDTLRSLQQARDAGDVSDALCIGLGELTETARPYAAEHSIAIWQAAELAQALRGIKLPAPAAR